MYNYNMSTMTVLGQQPCIGMFGTCGESTFRQDLFIPRYNEFDIRYFNPQLPPGTWKAEDALVEADHLAHDVVQTWPVLGSTYASGSLAEVGFSIASSLRAPTPLPKFVIPMIEMELDDSLQDKVARKESIRARELASAHLAKNPSPNVFTVNSLDEMLEVSVDLYGIASKLVELVGMRNPAFQRFMEGRNESTAFYEALRSGNLGKIALNIAQRHQT